MDWWVEVKNDKKRPGKPSISDTKRRVGVVAVLDRLGCDISDIDLMAKSWQKVLCPLHDDRVPSASVIASPREKSRFVCHSCVFGGDVVDLVQEAYGLDTKAALEWLNQEM